MNRRALFVALIVAGLGVFLMAVYQKRFETEASGGERIPILIAVKPIERGTQITDEMITTRAVPQAYVEDRAIKEVEKPKILGLKVGNPVQAQQTLMWTDLVTTSEDRRDLSSLVQPGNRAVTVKTSRDDSSVALIRPGDYVDVISVMDQVGAESRTAVVLLQKVLVLAAGLETSPDALNDKDRARSYQDSMLTLSLTVPEAQLLSLAAEKGKLTVALRNPDDQRTADQIPDLTSRSLVDSAQRSNIKGVRRPGGPVRIGESQ